MTFTEATALGEKIQSNINKIISGKGEAVMLTASALFAGGHILLDDVPGTGKTMLSKSLAKSIDAGFTRVQFTPDLLPSDLTGINYYNQKQGEFILRKGPLFTNILLADEINRAMPRTQSSLLECMEERQVTIDGTTYPLESPYFVIATQNPVETQGTFPLPEAQLDRFLLCISLGYPNTEDAITILNRFDNANPYEELSSVCSAADITAAQEVSQSVYIHPELMRYIISIVEKTREFNGVALGISPRGSISLMRACKAYALLSGRSFVTPEDIKYLAPHAFAHRLVLRDDYESNREKAAEMIKEVLGSLSLPSEKWDSQN
jgi:MoxR-like ATPase